MVVYLVYFAHRHLDFRLHEFHSALQLCGIHDPYQCYDESAFDLSSPFLEINLEKEEIAIKLRHRCILIKGIYELYGKGKSYEEVIESIKIVDFQFYFKESVSWCLDVFAFGKSFSQQEKSERRLPLTSLLPFKGDICLKHPDVRFCVIEHIGETPEERLTNLAQCIYFGRDLFGGQSAMLSTGRDYVNKHNLKSRHYLGPTSMDNELSLIMANSALVSSDSFVLDPFVGTGSILLACGTFGATCIGTDIDGKILHGKNKYDIFSNFQQYGISLPDIVNCDISCFPLQYASMIDAIVCDPPYGIRAGARKMVVSETKNQKRRLHHSSVVTQVYEAEDIMEDLLDLAAKVLVLGGRLVYILCSTNDFDEADLPCHPQLTLISVSKQIITQRYCRRMITMEKQSELENQNKNNHRLDSPKKSNYRTYGKVGYSNLREKIQMKLH